jgi:hypothetical protein
VDFNTIVREIASLRALVEELKNKLARTATTENSAGSGGGVASVAVTAPITNSGTPTAPNIGLGISPVLSVAVTAPVTNSGTATAPNIGLGISPVLSLGTTAPISNTGTATAPVVAIAATVASDGGTVVKQAATPGTAQTGNVNISGKLIAADLYPNNDANGIWNRLVNLGFTPGEHWAAGADQLAWVGYAAYTGFVAPAFPAYANSQFIMSHNTGSVKTFRYRAASTGANIVLRARVGITYVVSAGLMIDDGVNNADGNGANNFYRVYLTQAVLGGPVTAVEQYRSGGGAVTTNVGPTVPYGQFVGLELLASGTRWTSWAGSPGTFGEAAAGAVVLFTGGSTAQTWTPARVGLYAVWTAVDGSRKAAYDWYHEATS